MKRFLPVARQRVGMYGLLCLAAFVVLLLPRVGAAQAAPQNSSDRLASIVVTGSAHYRSDDIAAATGLHVGSEVAREDFQKAANTLAQLGSFEGVQYRFGTTEKGVEVQFQVTDAPTVPVAFDNFPWFADAELVAAVKSSVPLFDGTAPAHGTIIDAIADAIATALVKHGIEATVSHQLIAAPITGGQVQEFRAEGTNVNIAGVEFTDSWAQNDRAIQTRLAGLIGGPYSRRAIELFEFEEVRPIYLARSFLRVHFDSPGPKTLTTSASARITVVAPIETGAAYNWAGATWSGNSVIPSTELANFIPLKQGDPADGMKLEGAWQRVQDAYGRRGYLDVAVNPVPHFNDAAKTVQYSVSMDEGTQYRMGRLVLSGLSDDGERRIREAWKILAGAVFDKSAFDEFIESGAKQAFIGVPYQYEKIGHFLDKDPKTGLVTVMLDFQ